MTCANPIPINQFRVKGDIGDWNEKKPNYWIGNTPCFLAIVKKVQDGGFITVRGQPRNGPPPERTIALSEIDAPKMARRPTPNNKNPTPATDEPCAWESRRPTPNNKNPTPATDEP